MNCLKRPSRSLGALYPARWKVLGYEGCIGKKQAVQSIGYSVNHEESDGGAVEELLPYFLV